MAIRFTKTSEESKWIKLLVYGKSGVGKTRLCRTAPDPIIISSENKLISLSDYDIPVIVVKTIEDLEEALNTIQKSKYNKFKTVCIDSISDIMEVAISEEKKKHNDPRKAYGVIQDKAYELLRQIRDFNIGKHFYIIAKAKMTQNEDNVDMYGPKMPGQQMGPELPYLFDFVFPMRITDDDDEKGNYAYLQTTSLDDMKWDAKCGSGKLSSREEPNLEKIFKKLTRGKKDGKDKKQV